jgi:deazaflavin-dependent oxidoreductase (nitroreductase family)
MYRSGRPNRLASLMNKVAAAMVSAGLRPNRMVTLEVRGRRTGRTISVPLVPVEFEGERYLVAMLGTGTGWVVNVQAAGGAAVLRAGRRTPVRLEEVEVAARGPILRRYLRVAPGARPHIPVDRHSGPEAFEKVAARFPVFRIIRAAESTGPAGPVR